MKRKEEEKTQVTINVFRLIEKRKPSKGAVKREIKRKKFKTTIMLFFVLKQKQDFLILQIQTLMTFYFDMVDR